MEENKGNVIIYQSEDGVVRLDVRLEDKTVWLTIDQMAELFGKSRSTINERLHGDGIVLLGIKRLNAHEDTDKDEHCRSDAGY